MYLDGWYESHVIWVVSYSLLSCWYKLMLFIATKEYTFLAHLLAIDVHRTLTPLSYPPHTIALACLYLASFLLPQHPNSLEWRGEELAEGEELVEYPKFESGWTNQYESEEEDVSGELNWLKYLSSWRFFRNRSIDLESLHSALSFRYYLTSVSILLSVECITFCQSCCNAYPKFSRKAFISDWSSSYYRWWIDSSIS